MQTLKEEDLFTPLLKIFNYLKGGQTISQAYGLDKLPDDKKQQLQVMCINKRLPTHFDVTLAQLKYEKNAPPMHQAIIDAEKFFRDATNSQESVSEEAKVNNGSSDNLEYVTSNLQRSGGGTDPSLALLESPTKPFR